jgi:hypothetical protein
MASSSGVTSGMSDMKIGAQLPGPLAKLSLPLFGHHACEFGTASRQPDTPWTLLLSGDGKGGSSSDSDPLKWVFENEHIIGNGSFGVVYQAIVKNLNKVRARSRPHLPPASTAWLFPGAEDFLAASVRSFPAQRLLTPVWRATPCGGGGLLLCCCCCSCCQC